MIIVLKNNTPQAWIDNILLQIESRGLKPLYMPGTEKVVLGALGDERVLAELRLEHQPEVESVLPILSPYKLASRELYPTETVIDLEGHLIGSPHFTVIAGPCAIENRGQMSAVAGCLRNQKVSFMRGGAFKPRTSPYSFQGLGLEGLKILAEIGHEYNLQVVTEVLSTEEMELVAEYASILQIGARNMQNFRLLEAAGRTGKPILLKRGMSASIEDLLMSAEYILNTGNGQVILCERGIKTFENAYRNTLDLTAIPVLKEKTHLPVFVAILSMSPETAIMWFNWPRWPWSAGRTG